MIFSFGIRLILLVLILAAIVAVVGDSLGRSIGRKRLSILNLRPRHTAIAFTVTTGVFIALITILIILSVSRDARTALFGLEELRSQVEEKSSLLKKTKDELSLKISEKEKIDRDLLSTQKEVRQARQEITSLKKTKEELRKEVEISRKGTVLFKIGDVLLVSLIQAGAKKEKLETGLKQILSAADAYVRSLGIKSEKHLIFIPPAEFEKGLSILQKGAGETIIRVTATSNTVWGEEVPVRFEICANKLIYKTDELIAESKIAPSLPLPQIELEIKKLLSLANHSAKTAGVIADPSGSIGSVPYSEIFSLSKKIKAHKKGVALRALAKKDIYSAGPLEIKFRVFYQ